MRVSPRDLKAVRADGLVTRYAVLGKAVFAIVELPAGGTAGTALEEECQLEHWGLVLKGELTTRQLGHRRRLRAGTAFYVAPGPVHRFYARSRAVIAGFAPLAEPLDDSPAALQERGIEVIHQLGAPALPPTTIQVDAIRTRTAVTGRIETEAAVMGQWLFTRTSFGALSGHADDWCDLPHWGMVLEGNLVVRWEDSELELMVPGDVFHTPPGPPGHRIEVADPTTIVDYTPIRSVDDPGLRRARRALAARALHPTTTPTDPDRVPA